MAIISSNKLEIPTTTLGNATSFSGDLNFETSLRIEGRYSGKIESPGTLHIAPGAKVEADITVGAVVVAGTVIGNITASQRLEIEATGTVIGNIATPKLKVAEGVSFRGKCDMLDSSDGIDIFSASPDKLKKILTHSH
ncbi:polymer-forming cytoskeletal protein [Marispirochaeta sp.]|uniref:bactofilin family protein n=1 Tax=Marispirochaeta sp. TaxID=2038653 RepID=UPI0029C8DA30|nr:polymer-forming cytoskeletal protein [Marispirochaeta sp.]